MIGRSGMQSGSAGPMENPRTPLPAEALSHLDALYNLARWLVHDVVEAVHAHMGQCADCAALLQLEVRIRALIRAQAPRYTAPPTLKARVQDLLAESASPKESVTHGAAAFVYRDGSGRYTTLFLMPEAGIVIPDEGRMPIETFKPYHRVTSGRQLLLWKQRNLACLLVSDLDQAGMASMFLKIRKTA